MGKECVEERESEVSERYREQHAACLLVRKCKGVGDLLWRARAPKRATGDDAATTPISRESGHMLLGSAHVQFPSCRIASISAHPSVMLATTKPRPMSSIVVATSNFQFLFDTALADYVQQTRVDLTIYPFAEKLQNCQSADVILELLRDKTKEFKDYRDGNHKLIDRLNPVVQVVHAFSGLLGEALSSVSPSSSDI